MNVARLGRGTAFAVESESEAGVAYCVVALDGGQYRCSCPAGRASRMCKHVKQVQELPKYRRTRFVAAPVGQSPHQYAVLDTTSNDLATAPFRHRRSAEKAAVLLENGFTVGERKAG